MQIRHKIRQHFYLAEAVSDPVFAGVAAVARLSPRQVSVCWPIILARLTVAVKEILSCQDLLPLLPGVSVVEVSIVIIDFLIGEDGSDSMNYSISAIVGSGGVGAAGVVGQADAGVDCSPQLNILTINETVTSPDELTDLIRIARAGLDVLGQDCCHVDDFLMFEVRL